VALVGETKVASFCSAVRVNVSVPKGISDEAAMAGTTTSDRDSRRETGETKEDNIAPVTTKVNIFFK
jgi:hypothetical protein